MHSDAQRHPDHVRVGRDQPDLRRRLEARPDATASRRRRRRARLRRSTRTRERVPPPAVVEARDPCARSPSSAETAGVERDEVVGADERPRPELGRRPPTEPTASTRSQPQPASARRLATVVDQVREHVGRRLAVSLQQLPIAGRDPLTAQRAANDQAQPPHCSSLARLGSPAHGAARSPRDSRSRYRRRRDQCRGRERHPLDLPGPDRPRLRAADRQRLQQHRPCPGRRRRQPWLPPRAHRTTPADPRAGGFLGRRIGARRGAVACPSELGLRRVRAGADRDRDRPGRRPTTP